MKTFATLAIISAIAVAGTWLAQSSGSPNETQIIDRETLPVQVQTLTPVTSINRARKYSGTIVAARRTRLSFQRSARLEKVLVDEGDQVLQGDELAQIDQRQLLTQVAQLKAQLLQQKSILAELAAGPRQQTIAATRAELDSLVADVELRKATLDRTNQLYQRNGTSAQTLDESRLAWKSLVSKRESVQKQLDELEAGTRKERLEAQKAMVSMLEAQLESLKIDVADSRLNAPFAGTIVGRLADEGDMLNAQQPVFELLETSRMEAHIGIPTAMVGDLDTEDYHVLSAGSVEVTAKLRSVLSQVDATTRTQRAIFDIDTAHASDLADGQLVRLDFEELVAVDGFTVPLTALASGSRGLWTLYVVESDDESGVGTVVGRAVEVLHTSGNQAVIRGAIFADEKFVADGVHRVAPGQRVIDADRDLQGGDNPTAKRE